jgi:hypothetical protein
MFGLFGVGCERVDPSEDAVRVEHVFERMTRPGTPQMPVAGLGKPKS